MGLSLPQDFKEFLSLLRSHGVRYLLIGGHAVAYYGYPRATGDLDVWIAVDPENAARTVEAIREFGFDTPQLSVGFFLEDRSMVRMGEPPLRIEVLTVVSGIEFDEAYSERESVILDGEEVSLISLRDLLRNKRASGRPKDLADLDFFARQDRGK
ncbi:MAG TPA: nucleotidyltransferase [Longimicrobium sp.]